MSLKRNSTAGTVTFFIVLVFSLFASFAAAPVAAGAADCAAVPTDRGPVTGALSEDGALCVFKGIPFAAPPVGELRFRAPQEHEAWTAPLTTDKFGGECLQPSMPFFSSGDKKDTGGEDCLYLNIWQPVKTAGAKPVMVFIHGGGFIYGSGGSEGLNIYEGDGLAAMGDVVLVTFNYRLGIFGFMVHPALRDAEGGAGNYGLLDQVFALEWVKRNIANFGGDPNNVTIFGESAGGMSVGLQLISPMSKGLFSKAVIQSGPVLLLNKTAAMADEVGLKTAGLVGCGDPVKAAGCLRTAAAEKFMGEVRPVMFILEEQNEKSLPFEPVVDGRFLPDRPFALFNSGAIPDGVKVMLGTNSDEAAYLTAGQKIESAEDFDESVRIMADAVSKTFGGKPSTEIVQFYPVGAYQTPKLAFNDLVCDVAFTCPTRTLANLISARNPDVYMYYLSKGPVDKGPFAGWGAFHGADLLYIFRKFEFMNMFKLESKDNLALSDKMIALWSSFARTGVPAADGVPAWPRYESATQPYLQLDVEIKTGAGLKTEQCGLFDKTFRSVFEK